MTQEQKHLLLVDICARLPYGVMVNAQYKDGEGWKTEDRELKGIYEDGQVYVDCVYTNIENIKPYLRPLSSMTDEEYKEWRYLYLPLLHENEATETERRIDWLNAHHFDYRGLIPKGLALEAHEDMYK